jgi:hypothetical protein
VTTVTDDFNRSDAGTLGTSSSGHLWVDWNNSHTIVSNAAVPENDSTCGSLTPELDSGDHFAQVTVATLPQANSFVGLVVRGPATVGTSASTAGELVLCGVTGAGNNSWVIRTKANLSATLTTQATGANSTLNAGDVIRVEAAGTTVTVFQNGVQRVQWTSATLTTQKRVGIYTDLPTSAVTYPIYDTFSAADITVAGHASGTGTAHNPTIIVTPAAGAATGTGAASSATTTIAPAAGNAAGTGAANDPAAAISFAAGHASGTGAANAATGAVMPAAGHASGTGAATDPTVSIDSTAAEAPAGHASGVGAAHNATVRVASDAGGGNWRDLMAVLADARLMAREDAKQRPVACPNDGEPLRSGPRGQLFCPFDGWRP